MKYWKKHIAANQVDLIDNGHIGAGLNCCEYQNPTLLTAASSKSEYLTANGWVGKAGHRNQSGFVKVTSSDSNFSIKKYIFLTSKEPFSVFLLLCRAANASILSARYKM